MWYPIWVSSEGPLFPYIYLPNILFWISLLSSQLIIELSILFDVCAFRFSSFLRLVIIAWVIHSFLVVIPILPKSLFRISCTIFFTFPWLTSKLPINSSILLNICSNTLSHHIIYSSFLVQIPFLFSFLFIALLFFFTSAARLLWSESMSTPVSAWTSLILFLKRCFTRI